MALGPWRAPAGCLCPRRPQVPGAGLGLAVVQQTVQRLQGELQFLALAQGHTVRIKLPHHG